MDGEEEDDGRVVKPLQPSLEDSAPEPSAGTVGSRARSPGPLSEPAEDAGERAQSRGVAVSHAAQQPPARVTQLHRGRFGSTRREAAWTLCALLVLMFLLQHQLREGRGGGRERLESRNPISAATDVESLQPSDRSPQPLMRIESDPRSFHAQVVDPSGRPVGGARVQLGAQEDVADARGRFRLRWGQGRLRVSHDDFWLRELTEAELLGLWHRGRADEPATEEFAADEPPPAAVAPVRVLLVPGARVSGRILTAVDRPRGSATGPTADVGGGSPADGARVLISSGSRRWEVTADEEGRFSSPLLPSSQLSILVLHAEYLPQLLILPPSEDWRHELEVRLQPGERFAVYVENLTGDPLSDAEVWLRSQARSRRRAGEWEFFGWTDDLGRLQAARGSQRAVQIQVRAPGYRRLTKSLVDPRVHFRLRSAPALRGQVVDIVAGLPAALSRVELQVRSEKGFFRCPDLGKSYESLERGGFLVGLPPHPGEYRVALRAAGGLVGFSESVQHDGRESPAPLFVRLPTRLDLSGYVRSPHSMLAETRVELLEVPEEKSSPETVHGIEVMPKPTVVRHVETGGDGRFLFESVPPGRYRFHVYRRGWGEYFSPPFHPPVSDPVPISLSRGAALTGSLLGHDSQPERNVPLVLTEGATVRRVVFTDRSGRYRFDDLSVGHYTLALGRAKGSSVPMETRRLNLRNTKEVVFNIRRRRPKPAAHFPRPRPLRSPLP